MKEILKKNLKNKAEKDDSLLAQNWGEDYLGDEVYQILGRDKIRLFFFAVLPLTLGFLFYLPVGGLLSSLKDSLVPSDLFPNLKYREKKVLYFPPGLRFLDLNIPARSLMNIGVRASKDFTLDLGELALGLPGLYPFGPKIHFLLKKGKSLLDLSAVFSFGGIAIKALPSSQLGANLISQFDLPITINGDFRIEALFETSGYPPFKTSLPLKSGALLFESTNFELPGQTINNFEIAALPLKNFSLKARFSEGNVLIDSFVLGVRDQSIFYLQGTGDLSFSGARMFADSLINIDGDLQVTQEFLDSYGFINLFLGNVTLKEGIYRFKLSGSLSEPSFQIL